MAKIYVAVTAEHDENGKTKPLALVWTNGKRYEIDRVVDARLAPSLKGGGLGMRYTVRIRGKEVYLFEDEGKWFLEK
jgi:hypothetical protein